MGLKRLLLIVVFALAISLGLVPSAPAGNFDEERMGCTGENPGVCPPGATGTPYSIPIELLGDEDEACAVYSVSSGSLPPGIGINSDGARIQGTPTQAGTYDFFLTVTYNREVTCPFKNPSDDSFRITITEGLAKLTIGPESATPGTTGTPYALQMTATVADPKTWSISAGALPSGLSINASTGLISGTPTAVGQFDFQVLAKLNGDARSDTKSLAIVIRDRVAIVAAEPFTSARRAVGEVSAPFEAMLTASGGTGTYTWSLSNGTLPTGLLFADGAISGTPRFAGVYPFTVSATDTEGRVASYAARIVVAEKLAIATLLRPATVGRYFSQTLRTQGGVKPSTFRLVRGPLPRGIRFDRTIGFLYGTPTRPGRYRLTFEAKDALEVTTTKTLTLLVRAAPKAKT